MPDSTTETTTPEVTAKEPDKKQNRFVGEVQPNILDYYNTPTYNLKLYMIPEEERSAEVLIEDSGRELKEDTSLFTPSEDGGGLGASSITKSFQDQRAEPGKTVILAQTGVTAGIDIDDLELTSVTAQDQVQTTVTFTIKQPNAVTFIDYIANARQYLGGRANDEDYPLFLEINFQGYVDGDEKAEFMHDGTAPNQSIKAIAGPYIFPLKINNIAFRIDQAGSTYDFQCVIEQDLVFADEYTKMPISMTTIGSTIQEHMESLEKQLNLYHEKNTEENPNNLHDKIKFDLSKLIAQAGAESTVTFSDSGKVATVVRGKSPLIQNQSLIIPGKQPGGNESVSELDKEVSEAEVDNETVSEEANAIGTKEGKKVPDMKVLIHDKGKDIFDIIGTLLSMNEEFMAKALRGDYKMGTSEEMCHWPPPTESLWYKLKGDLKYIGNYSGTGKDEIKQRYKEITFKPMTFWETRTDKNLVTSGETRELDKEQTKAQVEAMNVVKAYHYYYTGRNDQILNLDINYQNGIAFLNPPQGATTGSVYANNPINFLTTPLSQSDLFDELGLGGLFDLFSSGKKLFDSFKNLKNNALNQIGEIAGLSPGQLKDFIADPKGSIAQGVANALTREGDNVMTALQSMITGGGGSSETQSGVFTESDNERQKQIDQFYREGDYDSSPSGYVYASELSMQDGKVVTAEEIENLHASVQEEIDKVKKKDEEGEKNAFPRERSKAQYITGPADDGVYSGTQSTLFNYLYNNNAAADFMVQLDMTLRGDPWYLGEVDNIGDGKSKVTGSGGGKSFTGLHEDFSEYHLLEVASPRYFDPDVYDEDNNTGEWSRAGFSYSLSGIYCIISAVNRFSGGVYTVDVKSTKMTGIDLSKLSGEGYLDGTLQTLDADGNPIDGYLTDSMDPRGLSATAAAMAGAHGGGWKNSPEAMDDYFAYRGNNADGEKITIDNEKEGIFTSEQADAYRKWKAEQNNSGGGG